MRQDSIVTCTHCGRTWYGTDAWGVGGQPTCPTCVFHRHGWWRTMEGALHCPVCDRRIQPNGGKG